MLLTVFGCFLLAAAVHAGDAPTLASFAGLWPQPQRQALTGSLVRLELGSLGASCLPGPCGEVLREALGRFWDSAARSGYRAPAATGPGGPGDGGVEQQPPAAPAPGAAPVTSLLLHVGAQGVAPGPGADESYELEVPDRGGSAIVRARTDLGALHALETLAQLAVRLQRGAEDEGQEAQRGESRGDSDTALPPGGSVWLLAGNVTDWPHCQHRGLLLVASRTSLSPDLLRSTLDAMAASKLNVLHWQRHGHAAAYEPIPAHPVTAAAEAEGGGGGGGGEGGLLRYARLRGIRLVLDTPPGHAVDSTADLAADPERPDLDPRRDALPSYEGEGSSSGGSYDDEYDYIMYDVYKTYGGTEEEEERTARLRAEVAAQEFLAWRRLQFVSWLTGGGSADSGNGEGGAAGQAAAGMGAGAGVGADAGGGSGGVVRRRRRRRVVPSGAGGGAMGGAGGGALGGGGGGGHGAALMRGHAFSGVGIGGGEQGLDGGPGGGGMMKKMMMRRKKMMMMRKRRMGTGGAGVGGGGGGAFGGGGGDDDDVGGDLYRRRALLGQRLRYYARPDGRGGEAWEPFLAPQHRGIGAGGGAAAVRATLPAAAAAAGDGGGAGGGGGLARGAAEEVAAVAAAGLWGTDTAGWCLCPISGGQDPDPDRDPGGESRRCHAAEPTDSPGSQGQEALVFGGEACVRGEGAGATELLSRTWPAVSAAAERLWSDGGVREEAEAGAEARLAVHGCRMAARGIPAQPLAPGG